MIVVDLLVGEQSGFDPLRKLDLLLGIQQGDLADLLQVVLHWVSRGTSCHHLLLGLVGVVGLGEGEALILGQLLLELRHFGRLERGLVYVVKSPFLADGEHDLLTFEVDDHISGQRFSLELDFERLQGDVLEIRLVDCLGLRCQRHLFLSDRRRSCSLLGRGAVH